MVEKSVIANGMTNLHMKKQSKHGTGGLQMQITIDKEKPTNGDVIKALFPDVHITDHFELATPIGNVIYVRLNKHQEMRVQQKWWDAPYKGGK